MKSAAHKNTNHQVHSVHYAIAEYGKLCALKGDHQDALKHYREAIKMAVSLRSPEVFFRHYTQCVLESLELTGSYDEVVDFCIGADRHYEKLGQKLALSSNLHKRDHASVLEKLGINHLKANRKKEAIEALKKADNIVGDAPLPIAKTIIQWLDRGYVIEPSRILPLQRKHGYFVVRKDKVNAKIARSIASLSPANTTARGIDLGQI